MENEDLDPVIVESVLQRLRATDSDLAVSGQDVEVKRADLFQAEKRHSELADIRSRLAAYLLKHGFVPPPPEAEKPTIQMQADIIASASMSARLSDVISVKQAVEIAAKLMANGAYWKVPAVHDAIKAQGYIIPVDDPVRRLTQAMSASKLFEADRTLGWRLKANPAEGLV